MDPTLATKLMEIECITEELTPEFLNKMNVSAEVNSELCHFLVHRLEGNPAEVVRTQANAHIKQA